MESATNLSSSSWLALAAQFRPILVASSKFVRERLYRYQAQCLLSGCLLQGCVGTYRVHGLVLLKLSGLVFYGDVALLCYRAAQKEIRTEKVIGTVQKGY